MQPNDNEPVVVNGQPMARQSKRRFSWGNKKARFTLIGVVVAVLIIAGVLTWALLGRDGISTETPVATVSISADGFTPGTIQIEKGQEVAWVNDDEEAHQVFALQDVAPGLDSAEILATGDTYIYTFEEAGTFNYYDPLNPDEYKGTVIVKE